MLRIIACIALAMIPTNGTDNFSFAPQTRPRGFSTTQSIAALPAISTATATAEVVNGFVVALNLTKAGVGYTYAPTISIIGGGGFGAVAVAHIANGQVTGFTVITAGFGYTTTPNVIISAPDAPLKLRLEPSHVELRVRAVLGQRYTVETSNDQINWMQLLEPFTATNETMLFEVSLARLGQFQRIFKAP